MGFLAFGLVAFLTFSFINAFVGAVMAVLAARRSGSIDRRGVHPRLAYGAITLVFAAVLFVLLNEELSNRRLSPDRFRVSFVVALVGLGLGTWVVAHVGRARVVLAATALGTVATSFLVPFLGASTSLLQEVPAIMPTFVPAVLGTILGGLLVCASSRQ